MENISLLCQKYFQDNKKINKYISPKIYRWVEKTITNEYAKMKRESSKKIVMVKILHTKYVLEAGLEILNNTQEINWNYYQAMTTCFLHDIGRFKQAIHSTYDDELSGIDHANVGANMFLDKGFKIEKKYHCNEKEIVEAIDQHSRKEYQGNNLYAKFIRDADKIGLFRKFDRLETWAKEEFKGNEISPTVFEEFMNKKNVATANRKTLADHYLFLASWFYDLNFEISKQIIINEKIPEKVLRGLKNLKVDKNKYAIIKKILDNFKYE